MSTKCTILDDKDYHFYFESSNGGYHLSYQNKIAFQKFLVKVGKILEGCPLSDSGIYTISEEGVSKFNPCKNYDKCLVLDRMTGLKRSLNKAQKTLKYFMEEFEKGIE